MLSVLQVLAELEEEKRKHAADTEQGDNVTYMLEKERERLKQEVVHNSVFLSCCLGLLRIDGYSYTKRFLPCNEPESDFRTFGKKTVQLPLK